MSKIEENSLELNNPKINNKLNLKKEKKRSKNKTSNKSDDKNQNNNNNFSLSKDNELDLTGKDLSTKDGISLINKIVNDNKNITKLILNNCNLTFFPKELLNLNNLSSLDICNNKFEDFDSLIQDLTKLNKLTDLLIDLENQSQVLQVLTNMPKLLTLNEKQTKSSFSIVDVDYKDIEDISLSNNLDYYNEIVRYLNDKDKNNSFAKQFQMKINEEGDKINNFLDKNIPNYIYANVTLKSQIELQKCLSEKFLEDIDKKRKKIGNYIFKIIFQTSDKLVNLINHLYPKILEKTENLRNELENAKKAAKELSDYELTYNNLKNNKLILETNLDVLKKKVDKLENENKFITEKLTKTPRTNYINYETINKYYSYTINHVNRTLNKMNPESNNKNNKSINNQQFNTFDPNNSDNKNQINYYI